MRSYPTKPILISSLPVVRNLNVEFRYRNYENNEISREGKPNSNLRPGEIAPRSNVISWTNPWESIGSDSIALYNELVRDKFRVNNTLDVFVGDFCTIQKSDTGVSSRVSETIDRICGANSISGTTADKALVLSQILSGSVEMNSSDFSFLQKYADNDPGFISTVSNNGLKPAAIEKSRGITCSVVLNNRISNEIIRKSFNRSQHVTSLTNDLIADRLTSVQSQAQSSPVTVNPQDYVPTLVPTRYTEDIFRGLSQPIPVAIQVKRSTIKSNGEVNESIIDTIPAGRNQYVDTSIRYGTRYSYKVSIVWCGNFVGTLSTQDVVQSRCFVLDEFGETQSVTTEENSPPLPPSDILYYYDHVRQRLMIRWSYPSSSQGDVTRVQLFRRKTIYEPFTLLREFDFDQSVVSITRLEAPNESNVVKSEQFVGLTEDPDFGKSSSYIYAMATTDAHGLVSNYSSQVQVSFDRIRNSLQQELVSYTGAPRQYPNFFLTNSDFTQDVIVSNMSGMEVYFDPEYIKVINSDSRPVFQLATDPNSRYKITLLDTTRAQQKNVSVSIQDLRKSLS